MKPLLDQVAAVAAAAARAHVGEGAKVTGVMPLARGVDPFAGRERPLMFAAARWMAVSPGGVLLGGTAAAAAAILGFALPERAAAPAPAPAAAADQGESTGAAQDAEPGDEEPAPAPAPATTDSDDAAEDAPAEAPWSERACDVARPALAALSLAIAAAVAALTDLPADCAPVQVALTSEVRQDAGAVPDGIALSLQQGAHELLVVVVTPGIFLAHLAAGPVTSAPEPVVLGDGIPVAPDDIVNADAPTAEEAVEPSSAPPVSSDSGLLTGDQLRAVPLELAVRMGRVRMPLAAALELVDGDVIELEELVDDAVELVAGSTPVASGTLEVGEHGALLLHVGQRTS